MRLFAIFDEDKDGVLTEDEFTQNLAKVFISAFDTKLQLVFKVLDSQEHGKVSEENVQFILKHCNFEGLQEDTDVVGDSSPKEGKYSSNLNSYMSFIDRNQY